MKREHDARAMDGGDVLMWLCGFLMGTMAGMVLAVFLA
jgi:hypothetical protein